MSGCTASIHPASFHAAPVMNVFGRLTGIPIQSPLPFLTQIRDLGEKMAYLIDIGLLTPEERERMVSYISNRFWIPPSEVERDLDRIACPLLADDVTVSVPQGIAFSMMGDDLGDGDDLAAEIEFGWEEEE